MEITRIKIRKSISTLTYLIIIFAIIYVAFQIHFPKQFGKIRNSHPYVVISDSMEPVIPVNSLIYVSDVRTRDLVVGDIITFSYDVNFDGTVETVTHAIADISYNKDNIREFKTLSEKTGRIDPWTLFDSNIKGKVTRIIPKAGFLVTSLSKVAMPLLIFLQILIWLSLRSLFKNWKKH